MEITLVCFAHSRKKHGRCFAGKNLKDKRWIRPISNRTTQELIEKEECIKDVDCNCIICEPEIPKLMDIIKIQTTTNDLKDHQSENYLISDEKWLRVGKLDSLDIDDYLDSNTNVLWVNGHSSYNRLNDRVPEKLMNEITDSLKLIEVDRLSIRVVEEHYLDGNHRKRVYGEFEYKGISYILPITDYRFERDFMKKDPGTRQVFSSEDRVILCISLASEFEGYCYKLIAGIILI